MPIIRPMPDTSPPRLSTAQRQQHRADAHHLKPVVQIGSGGLAAAVEKEVDAALRAHGLIKVRVADNDRAAREHIYTQLCEKLAAAPVQHIGKLLVLWRAMPQKPAPQAAPGGGKSAPREVSVRQFGKRAGEKPQIKQLRVLGNQRLTQGGQVKRAKVRQKSLKKF